MDFISIEKQALRAFAKNFRKTIDVNVVSEQICSKIFELKEFVAAENVLIFYPKRFEVNILPIVKKTQKNFYLPRVAGEELEICSCTEELCLSEFGVQEPEGQPVLPSVIDIVFVPALMADEGGYRLGYGKGYYDRFLAKLSATTVVPIFDELISQKRLPINEFDRRCDIVLSEKRLIRLA